MRLYLPGGKLRPRRCRAVANRSHISSTSLTFMCRRPHSRLMSLAVPMLSFWHHWTIARSSLLKTLRCGLRFFHQHCLYVRLHIAVADEAVKFAGE